LNLLNLLLETPTDTFGNGGAINLGGSHGGTGEIVAGGGGAGRTAVDAQWGPGGTECSARGGKEGGVKDRGRQVDKEGRRQMRKTTGAAIAG